MTINQRDNPGAVIGTIILAAALIVCAWQAFTQMTQTPYQSPPYVEKQLDCGPNGTAKSYKGVAVCAHN